MLVKDYNTEASRETLSEAVLKHGAGFLDLSLISLFPCDF